MNSSMVEQWFVKPKVIGSNPFSSSNSPTGRHGSMHPAATRNKEVRIFCGTQFLKHESA